MLVRRYVPPALFVLTALAVKLLLRDYVLEQESPFVLFFSAVLLSAWWGGFAVGMSATAVCAALALTLFLRGPGEGLQASDVIRTVVFIAEGVFVSTLAGAFKQQQERFRGTFEQAAVGMAHVDPQGRWLRVNDRLCEITGYSRRELLARTFQDLTHPDDRDKEAEQPAALAAGRISTYSVEKRCVRKDGATVWINLTGSMARGTGGRTPYFIVVVEDIDARRRMEDELRIAHQQLTFHLNNSPLGAVVWDRNFRIVSWSQQCERIFGWTAAEVMGRHPRDFPFVHEDDAFEVGRIMAQLQSGSPRNVHRNRNHTREGGTITCEWYNSVLFDPAGMPESIQSLVLDVTERVQAEEDLRQLTAMLEQKVEERTVELRSANERLAARELALSRSNADLASFAYVASHDLQEPLRMVASYTQLLARRYSQKLDDDAREFIEYAVDGVRRMQRLIDDLLAYSRVDRQGGPLGPVAVASAVEAALTALQTSIEETGARIEVGPLPEVNGNEVQLTQVFQNLIGNAIKFRGDEPPRIEISAVASGAQWELTVRDHGIGIDPAFAERIFVVFQRLHTRAEYAGTGIGLAICKKVVEHHGGRIWLDTSVSGGAAFKFTLAAAPVAVPGAA